MRRRVRTALALLLAVAVALAASACGRSGSSGSGGGSSTKAQDVKTIKIGGSFPMSGPLSGLATITDGMKAYFGMVNAQGGVNGRRIDFTILDDGYEPARTLQNVQKLVQQDNVFALFGTLGTATNLATWDYVTQNRVPDLFLYSGAPQFGSDPAARPYTMPGIPSYAFEGSVYAKYIEQHMPTAKVAVLFQNDDYGKGFLGGFLANLRAGGAKVVAQESYEATDPTVDPEVTKLSRSGANVFVNFASPKFAAQAIKQIAAVGWHPQQFVNSVAASKAAVLVPAGVQNAKGVMSIQYYKDPQTPRWASDPEMQAYRDAMAKYAPGVSADNPFCVQGWTQAELFVAALRGMRTVSREGLMEAARNLNEHLPMMLPDIDVKTSPTDYFPIESLHLERFDGNVWQVDPAIIRDEH